MGTDLTTLAERFRVFARHCHGSPLYEALALAIAEDPEILELVEQIEHNPQENILFAAVHHLLLAGADDPLARFYPSVGGEGPASDAYPAFRAFVLRHAAAIIELGHTRYVQTNEVRRSALLLPGVGLASRAGRVHLVDVGASAGANLVLDRFHYDYGGLTWGDPDSPLALRCEARGDAPPMPDGLDIGRRVALDLHPVDPGNPLDRAWLRALIWPEHHERARRLEIALDLAASADIEHIAGDALETLPGVLASLPAGETAAVIHSFSLVQLTAEQRRRFAAILAEEAGRRPVWRIGLEIWGIDKAWAELRVGHTGNELSHPVSVAEGHPHGEWISWLVAPF